MGLRCEMPIQTKPSQTDVLFFYKFVYFILFKISHIPLKIISSPTGVSVDERA